MTATRSPLPIRRIRLLSIAAIPLVVTLLIAPRQAEACSCDFQIDLLQPADGATAVPTNARVWLGDARFANQFRYSADAPWVELRDESGAPVSITSSLIRGIRASVMVLTPEELLEPGGTYSIVYLPYWHEDPEVVLSTFSVGSGPLESSPWQPGVSVVSANAETWRETPTPACGPMHSAHLRIDAPEEAVIILLDEGSSAEVDPSIPLAEVTAVSTRRDVILGAGVCDDPWPEAAPGARTEVRVAAFDIAGNFSGFGEVEHVVLPSIGLPSCASADRGAPLGGLVAMVVFLLWSRSFGPRRAAPAAMNS